MEHELSLDLILHRDVQKLLDNFASVIHAHVSFFGPGGELLQQGKDEGNCRFCQLIQHKISSTLCRKLDQEKQRLARETEVCQTYLCHAGLWEAVMPVKSEKDLLGYIMFGQFRKSDRLPEELSRLPLSKTELRDLTRAFKRLPILTEEAMENLTGLMKLLVDYIVRNELVTRGRDYFFQVINRYIEDNLNREMSLAETARYFGRSVSSFAHFLAAHHTTFKQLLIRKRLEHAEKIMKKHPQMTIKEIAEQSGFADPYYFSRLYRKIRNCTPGQFRKKTRLFHKN